MARIRVRVKLPRPNIRATVPVIHEAMTRVTIDMLKTWVLETVEPIPVWSGAARASFLFLAAKAFTSIVINPIAPEPPGSRISLGITEATAEVIAEPAKLYGWTWESTLVYIGVVEDRVKFIEAGLSAIRNQRIELPQPKFKT